MGNAEASGAAGAARSQSVAAESDPRREKSRTLVVLEDYPSPDIGEPIFSKGEKLEALSEQDGWLQVCCAEKEDYIPKKLTGNVYGGWLFEGLSRHKAEELLKLPGLRPGSFMIRESLSEKGLYSLSVWNNSVKHYRIFHRPTKGFYIFPRVTFRRLDDLVNHYSESADGLCCALTTPCLCPSDNSTVLSSQVPPVVMRCKFDWRKVDRSELEDRSTLLSPESRDSALSFGLRSSLAAYVSLMEHDDTSKKASRKSKIVFCMPPD